MDQQPSLRARQALDAVVYASALAAVVVAGATLASFALGGGWVGVKFILFFVGIGLFGIGTFKLRPTPPWRDEKRLPSSDRAVLQPALEELPPLNRYGIRSGRQVPMGMKLLLGSVLILGVSFVIETVFGVAR